MYEGLLKGVGDADEVSSLVDAIGSGLSPRPHGQVAKQVAVVVERVRHPRTTFLIPSCNKHGPVQLTSTQHNNIQVMLTVGWSAKYQVNLVQRSEAGEGVLVPWLRRKRQKIFENYSVNTTQERCDDKILRCIRPFLQINSFVEVQESSLNLPGS